MVPGHVRRWRGRAGTTMPLAHTAAVAQRGPLATTHSEPYRGALPPTVARGSEGHVGTTAWPVRTSPGLGRVPPDC